MDMEDIRKVVEEDIKRSTVRAVHRHHLRADGMLLQVHRPSGVKDSNILATRSITRVQATIVTGSSKDRTRRMVSPDRVSLLFSCGVGIDGGCSCYR